MEYLILGLLGLSWGSFANVCIYRLPKNKSIVTGRSFCPSCKKKIKWFDNIPLISFLLLSFDKKSVHTRSYYILVKNQLYQIFCLLYFFIFLESLSQLYF